MTSTSSAPSFPPPGRRPATAAALVLLAVALTQCAPPPPVIRFDRIQSDLVELVYEAEVRRERPDAPVAPGTFETALKKSRGRRAKGGERPAILAPPPSEIAFDLAVPPGAAFVFAAGIDLGDQDRPVRVRFEAALDGRTLFDRVLAPCERLEDRDWIEHREDLAGLAGRKVHLVLRTSLEGSAPPGDPVLCGWGTPRVTATRTIPRDRATRARPNVVFIVVDTLRADHLGCYGYGRPTSPHLDALASEGTLYERAVAPSPWTWPSTASLLTGLYPYTHGVLNADRCYLPSAAATLAETLREARYTTMAVSANPLVCRAQNFDQGFETFEEAFHAEAAEVTDRFLAWLDSRQEYRFFAYLHYFDPHMPYHPPSLDPVARVLGHELAQGERDALNELSGIRKVSELARRPGDAEGVRALYDGEIRHWDAQLGRLRGELQSRGLWDRTVVVVTSDHGEELFDHGRIGHARTLYDELLLVPLVLRDPRTPGGRRVRAQVETLRIAPTILDLTGLAIPDGVQGAPLPPPPAPPEAHAAGGRGGGPAFSTTERWEDPSEAFLRTQNSIRLGDWKLISVPETGSARLFHHTDDPGEHTDVAPRHPDEVRKLTQALGEWVARTRARSLKGNRIEVHSKGFLEQLRKLGYLAPERDDRGTAPEGAREK